MIFSRWLAFFAAAWLISLSPGPAAMKSMHAGLRHGWRMGWWNILGLELGVILLVAIVGAGLGAALAASRAVFDAVKWLGAAYLIWLGVRQWRATPTPVQLAEAPGGQASATTPGRLVLEAFLINATNPKGIVFMLAVLPQFIDPRAPQWSQYAVCCATLMGTDLVVMNGYTLLASKVLGALNSPRQARALNRAFGGLFVGAGALLAAFHRA